MRAFAAACLLLSTAALASTPMPPCLGPCSSPDDSYFQLLKAHPRLDIAVAFADQAEVEKYHHGKYSEWGSDPSRPRYDATENAQVWPMANGKRSYFIGQSRIPVRTSAPAVSLFYWEVKWDESWADRSNWNAGMGEHKAFQLRKDGNVNLTLNERYDWLGPYPNRKDIAKISWSTRDPWRSAVSNDNQQPPSNWIARAGVWTHYWYWIDMANNQVAVWAADDDRSKPTYLGLSRDLRFDGDRRVNEFIWEWNMSRSGDGSASTPVYGRNFVHIRDISFEEAKALVGQY